MLNFIKKSLPILIVQNLENELVFFTEKKYNYFFLLFFKKQIGLRFNILSNISGIDFFDKKYRFCITYDLLSIKFNSRIRLKVFITEFDEILSSTAVYPKAAEWWEREILDLFGIFFKKHPDLRRIITDYGFENYPLRKDFPTYGFMEVKYNFIEKKVKYIPTSLINKNKFNINLSNQY